MTAVLGGLFLSALLSATLLPGSSEIVLAGIISADHAPVAIAVVVATLGNSLGSCTNWGVGRYLVHFRSHRWFPVKPDALEHYSRWYQRWGVWSLLASWVPIIGDPITVIAGIARTPLLLFTALVFIAKGARYLIIAGTVGAIS